MVKGYRISELRENKRLSQSDLAKRLGMSQSTIAMWETNKRSLSDDQLNKLADFFGVTSDYLLGRTDEKNDNYSLSEKETKDIAIEVQNMLEGMNTDAEVNFYGEPMSDDDKELLAAALETALQVSKRAAKKKFTRNDYKDKKSGG